MNPQNSQRFIYIPILMFGTMGVVIIWAVVQSYVDEANSETISLPIIGKTIVSAGRSEYEACIVENNHQRIIVDNNGCAYEIGDRVMVKFLGHQVTITGLA